MDDFVDFYFENLSEKYKFKFFDCNVNHIDHEFGNNSGFYNNRYWIIGIVFVSCIGLVIYNNYDGIYDYFFPQYIEQVAQEVQQVRQVQQAGISRDALITLHKDLYSSWDTNWYSDSHAYRSFLTRHRDLFYGVDYHGRVKGIMFGPEFDDQLFRWLLKDIEINKHFHMQFNNQEWGLYRRDGGKLVLIGDEAQLSKCYRLFCDYYFTNNYLNFTRGKLY